VALLVALLEHLLHVNVATLDQLLSNCQLDLFYQRVLTQIVGLIAQLLNSSVQRPLIGLSQLSDLLLFLVNLCLELCLQQI
jgi:hypothetical protein